MLARALRQPSAAAARCASSRNRRLGPWAAPPPPARRAGGGAAPSRTPLAPAAGSSNNGSQDPDFVMVPWDASRETWDEESAQRMANIMHRFDAADKDGNGVIDREELRALLEHVGGGTDAVPMSWLTDDDVDAVMAQYDTNGDGVISFGEFAKMAQDNVFLAGKLEEYQQAFRAVDSGGNGTISATELFQLFQKLEQPISYDKLVHVMQKYDVDQSGVIDFGEFLRMFRGELLDLQDILDYLKKRTAGREAALAAKAAANAGAAAVPAAVAAATEAPAAPAPAVAAAPAATAAAAPSAPTADAADAAEEAAPGAAGGLLPGGDNLFFSEDEFDAVLGANPGRMVVLMASVTWCRPCRAFQEKYEKTAQHYGDAIFLKFYGNSNESTKALFKDRLKCRTTPTFFVFNGGRIAGQCTGAKAGRLEALIREAYGPEGPPQPPLWPAEEAAAPSPAAA